METSTYLIVIALCIVGYYFYKMIEIAVAQKQMESE